MIRLFTHGAVAQLGERHNGIVEVVGSIPIGSTIFLEWWFLRGQSLEKGFFYAPMRRSLRRERSFECCQPIGLRGHRERLDTRMEKLICYCQGFFIRLPPLPGV